MPFEFAQGSFSSACVENTIAHILNFSSIWMRAIFLLTPTYSSDRYHMCVCENGCYFNGFAWGIFVVFLALSIDVITLLPKYSKGAQFCWERKWKERRHECETCQPKSITSSCFMPWLSSNKLWHALGTTCENRSISNDEIVNIEDLLQTRENSSVARGEFGSGAGSNGR